MGVISDKLETVISLKDDYSAKAAGITASTLGLSSAFSKISNPIALVTSLTVAGTAASVASAAFNTFRDSLMNVGSLMGGLAAMKISQPFLDAAQSIDTMERQLGALLGSMQKGKDAMKWVQSYGLVSGLEQGPLLEMTKTLLMGGKRPGQYLPIMETISMMGGGDMNTNATDVASVFRRLMGGQIADAFGPEGLGRFGINKTMLGQYGAQFDNQGRFKGTVQDALDVLERMVSLDPRLKDLKASMDSSIAVKMSNLTDAFNLAKSEIGKAIADWIVPKLTELSTTLSKLAKSGVLKGIAERFTALFGLGGEGGMSKGLLTVVAAGDVLIGMMGDMRNSFAQTVNTISKVIDVLTFGAVKMGSMDLFEGFKILVDARVKEYQKALAGVSLSSNEPMPQGVQDISDTQTKYLAQISDNTRKTADYQRMLLGGGSMAALGATPVELKGIRRGGKLEQAVQLIKEVVSDEIAMSNRATRRLSLAMS